MNSNARLALVCSVVLSFALTASSAPAAALDRSGGDFWKYDATMDFEGAEMSGWVKYSYDGKDSLTVGGNDYGVSVMKVEGNLAGSMEILTVPVDLSAAASGYSYESSDGIAIVMEDVFLYMNMSMNVGGFFISIRQTMETKVTYSPPYLSGFEPGETGAGDSWEETVAVTTTMRIWENDTLASDETSTETDTYSFDVASSEQTVTTPAGTFDTLVLTVTNTDSGDYERYWISEKVRNIVKKESWEEGGGEPFETLVLSDYDVSDLMVMLFIGLAIAVAAVAVIVLALVMMKRRAKPTIALPPPAPPAQ